METVFGIKKFLVSFHLMTTKDTQSNFKGHNCHDLQMTRLSISRDECFDAARVDGYFYLGLTKQNMTCHYFDF